MAQQTVAFGGTKFALWHLLTLTFAFAILLSIFRVSRNTGLVLSVTVVPTLVLLAVMQAKLTQFHRKSRTTRAGIFLLVSSLFFCIYVLSQGPVVACVDACGFNEPTVKAVFAFYDPVRVLQFHTPVGRLLDPFLDWWTECWGWS